MPTTASQYTPKKRKLAPFATLARPQQASFDTELYDARRSETRTSSSPRPQTASEAPSPSDSTRPSPPEAFKAAILPPHLQQEVAAAAAAESPSGAFAEVTIDSGDSVDMSGGENERDASMRPEAEAAEHVEIQRAASPAKRSAGEMEGVTRSEGDAGRDGNMSRDGDVTMTNGTETQDTLPNSLATSAQGTMSTNTSATSFQSEELPPYSAEDTNPPASQNGSSVPSLEDQVSQVHRLAQTPLQHGDRGYVVSNKWLARVLSRTNEGRASTEYSKEAREGDIGPVDNSDIVPNDAFSEPILGDSHKQPFIPLKPGLLMDTDFEILPADAWGLVVGWYGMKQTKQIVRYAHDTAEEGATSSNVVYELYPPIFTVRKLPQPDSDDDRPSSDKSRSAANELRIRNDRRKLAGQQSPDDALRLVSSKQERSMQFLTRAKELAGISLGRKVRIFRVLKPTNIAVDAPDNTQSGVTSGTVTAPASAAKLIVEPAEWEKMEIGRDLEQIDLQDQTGNEKYNGKMTIETLALFENQTLILEEQKGGPGGGEFASSTKKRATVGGKKVASKPGSTTASGRTSPTPGSGMVTRGRTRRDGRTRGTVGLSNLGNTCYMNSALQCIRSVEELAVYFLQGKFKDEINANNPLSSGGVMAKKYSEVLQGIYSDNASSSISPTNFKKALSNLNPVFSGWGQQDSQEFLSYLIDSIHEDLNRIQKKPYLENPDSDDAKVTDPEYIKELGQIYQNHHYARNDSVCMDLFSGFYKNTMECPVCDKVSVTFDPFASLTLQLPVENTVVRTFTFVPLTGSPVNHDLDLEKSLSVKDIKRLVASKHDGVDPSKLWMVEVYNHKVYKHFDDRTTVAEAGIQANDYIFIFELAAVPKNIPPPPKSGYYATQTFGKRAEELPDMDSEMASSFAVPIFHRKKNRFGSGWDASMHPQYITLQRDEARSYDTILKKVLYAVQQLTSRPILAEADEDERNQQSQSDGAKTPAEGESGQEDAARVSDHSVPSEDGYVDVSVDQAAIGETNATTAAETNGDTSKSAPLRLPAGFMDASYDIPKILRNQLFVMNYARGTENMLCTGMSGFEDKHAKNVLSRVKLPSRRDSMDSSSTEQSSESTADPANADEEESDEDEESSALPSTEDTAMSVVETGSEADGDELPDNPLEAGTPRSGRRRGNNKGNKFKAGHAKKQKKPRVYGKNKGRNNRPGSRDSLPSSQSQLNGYGDTPEPDDNPYYVKLGECIVLDWYPEAVDSVFGGNPDDSEDLRGHFLSDKDGRDLPVVHDPATEAKRTRREQRKKNGITLEDCFMETGKREKLSEDNAWYCNRCKELRQATKTLEIWRCPDIVVVHLKRFGGTRSFRDKIDVMVDYPVEGLDLTEKIGQKEDGKSYVYDLFAVDNHFGGLGGGHYTAYAKNFFDQQWYDYNGKLR